MALFTQDSPTRIRITNPRYFNISSYGSFDSISTENTAIKSNYPEEGFEAATGLWFTRRFIGGITQNADIGSSTAQDIFVNLTPGKFYRMFAWAPGSNVSETFTIDTRGSSAPWPPSWVNIMAGPYAYTTISWIDNSIDESGFELVRETMLSAGATPDTSTWGNPITFTIGTNITTYVDTNTPVGSYRYKVRAVNQFGSSPYSAYGYCQIISAYPTSAPAAPTSVTVSVSTQSGIPWMQLNWNGPLGDNIYYSITLQLQSGATWTDISSTLSGNPTAMPARMEGSPPIDPGVYRYSIVSKNAAGSSVASVSNTFSIAMPSAPAAPSNLTSSSNTTSVILNWVDNSSNETGFDILRQTLSGATWGSDITFQASAGATTYTDSTVVVNTYRYQVRAKNAAGTSAYTSPSQITFTPPSLIPSAPSNLATLDNGNQSVTLSWVDNSTNETNFEIARQFQSGSTWGSSTIITISANATSYIDTGLATGNYQYQIRAINANGQSAWTAWTPVTVGAAPTVPVNAFLAQYYNGVAFNTLVASRTESSINYTWVSNQSPLAGVNGNNFSIRWTGDWDFSAASYQFSATTDDGMRVYIDGTLVIDKWLEQAATTYTYSQNMTSGRHRIMVEYYQVYGPGSAIVSWQSTGTVPAAPSNLTATVI